MAWVKSATTFNGFDTYTETIANGSLVQANTPSSALPGFIGDCVLTGTVASTGTTADAGTAMTIECSVDGTNYGTIKTLVVVALTAAGCRGFTADLTGIVAPYFRIKSPVATTGNGTLIFRYSIKKS